MLLFASIAWQYRALGKNISERSKSVVCVVLLLALDTTLGKTYDM
jgi:hypothetical protein